MKALILNNNVVDIASAEFEVHSDLTWVECGNTVEVGYKYDATDKTFTNPNAATAEQIKATADKLAARIAAKKSGNAKLLALGLTQEEATAMTGYTPPS